MTLKNNLEEIFLKNNFEHKIANKLIQEGTEKRGVGGGGPSEPLCICILVQVTEDFLWGALRKAVAISQGVARFPRVLFRHFLYTMDFLV